MNEIEDILKMLKLRKIEVIKDQERIRDLLALNISTLREIDSTIKEAEDALGPGYSSK